MHLLVGAPGDLHLRAPVCLSKLLSSAFLIIEDKESVTIIIEDKEFITNLMEDK